MPSCATGSFRTSPSTVSGSGRSRCQASHRSSATPGSRCRRSRPTSRRASRSAGALAFEHWGHGYATEAARLALDFGFSEAGLDEIVSFTSRKPAVDRGHGAARDDVRGRVRAPAPATGAPAPEPRALPPRSESDAEARTPTRPLRSNRLRKRPRRLPLPAAQRAGLDGPEAGARRGSRDHQPRRRRNGATRRRARGHVHLREHGRAPAEAMAAARERLVRVAARRDGLHVEAARAARDVGRVRVHLVRDELRALARRPLRPRRACRAGRAWRDRSGST